MDRKFELRRSDILIAYIKPSPDREPIEGPYKVMAEQIIGDRVSLVELTPERRRYNLKVREVEGGRAGILEFEKCPP